VPEVLRVRNIDVFYGSACALSNVSFDVGRGEIVSLIGANGAGKTTVLRAVSGILRVRSGTILYKGENLAPLPPHAIARMGIAHVPEGRGVFSNMSVMENLEMGAYAKASGRGFAADVDKVFSLFPRLSERSRQLAGTLSGGEQQMLAIGRAMVARPALMLLDEPSMGLAPLLVEEIFSHIGEINRTGATILLVEQNASMALSVAHRAYVLEAGRIAMSGDAAVVRNDPLVRTAYLGDVSENAD
jgi:branched-chain amino acid transport system ATP-binding protein